MSKIDLKALVREEIESILKEYTSNNFDMMAATKGYGSPIKSSLFMKILPKSEKSSREAMKRLSQFQGGQMFTHSQAFVVQPKGSSPDKPTFYFGQSQFWLRTAKVNVTMLIIQDITEAYAQGGDRWYVPTYKSGIKKLGWAFADTDTFLNECRTLYTIVDQSK